jgi:polyisoprenoid-binding protein YceI
MAKWNLDPDHTVAAFAIQHLTIAKVRGQFNKINGSLDYDQATGALTGLRVAIDLSSLHTGIKKRDIHLVSPDFFDAVKNPEITFRSTECAVTGNRGRIEGELTVRTVTRPVTLEVVISGPIKLPADFGGETTVGLAARAIINREDFGLDWNVPLADLGVMIASEVEITLDGEADLAE